MTTSVANSNPSFMGLPVETRRQILRHSGLLISIRATGFVPAMRRELLQATCRGSNLPQRAYSIPTALLPLNRQLRYESASILYGENFFHIHFKCRESFRLLKSLSEATCALIRDLRIMISPYIQPVFMPYQTVWSDFYAVISSPSFQDCRLHLDFDFRWNARNETIQAFADIKRLSNIQHVGLSLGMLGTYFPDLTDALILNDGKLIDARDAKLTVKPPFPFERLPTELRFMILSHTGLIDRRHRICLGKSRSCAQLCCGSCSVTPHDRCYCCILVDCFSSSCTCWTPSALLCLSRTSKQFYCDTNAVFFSENKFVVKPHEDRILWITARLRKMSATHFGLIRDLELQIEYFDDDRPQAWTELLDMLRQRGHPNLLLTIVFRKGMHLNQGSRLTPFAVMLEKILFQIGCPFPDRLKVTWLSLEQGYSTYNVATWKGADSEGFQLQTTDSRLV